jgi:hypothetical protein
MPRWPDHWTEEERRVKGPFCLFFVFPIMLFAFAIFASMLLKDFLDWMVG